MEIEGTCIMPGIGEGTVLATGQPISFWGCVNPATGRISDKRHDLYGESISGKVLIFPYGKGSSTGSLMILELLRLNLAPAGIINARTEPLLATGPIVGKHFYGKSFPIVTVAAQDIAVLKTGLPAAIKSDPNGSWVRLTRSLA
jgi:predicted aconitase with swiveling domain